MKRFILSVLVLIGLTTVGRACPPVASNVFVPQAVGYACPSVQVAPAFVPAVQVQSYAVQPALQTFAVQSYAAAPCPSFAVQPAFVPAAVNYGGGFNAFAVNHVGYGGVGFNSFAFHNHAFFGNRFVGGFHSGFGGVHVNVRKGFFGGVGVKVHGH